MRRRLLIVLILGAVLAAGALFHLRSRALEMIHAVVLNAVVQRLPENYPEERVEEAFRRRLESAETQAERDRYLAELKEISLVLEKVQRLEDYEVDRILERIRGR